MQACARTSHKDAFKKVGVEELCECCVAAQHGPDEPTGEKRVGTSTTLVDGGTRDAYPWPRNMIS